MRLSFFKHSIATLFGLLNWILSFKYLNPLCKRRSIFGLVLLSLYFSLSLSTVLFLSFYFSLSFSYIRNSWTWSFCLERPHLKIALHISENFISFFSWIFSFLLIIVSFITFLHRSVFFKHFSYIKSFFLYKILLFFMYS